MKDIERREDLLLIMEKFYDKLLVDETISFFFTKITNTDKHLEEHFGIHDYSNFILLFVLK